MGRAVGGAHFTATVPGEAVAIVELLPVEVAQAVATVPGALPPRPPRPQRRGGGGLLGLLAVPFVGRQAELEAVWACLVGGQGHRITRATERR